MSDTSFAGRRVRRSDPDIRAGASRRLLAAPLLGLIAAAVLLLMPARASADSASTLTVLGTSDVSDSGLIANVIQPGFQAAYPQFTFKYTGSASGTAIQNAENGTGSPSALIVHASSLENQFVAGGFSYNNQYGNAIFRNDFVLAGPKGDPAGVGANAANNIAQAFADIASAGVAGKATFISRGGTNTASGTTIEEHALWALMDSSGLTPANVLLCDVSAADGGGETPIQSGAGGITTPGQPCPDSGTVDGTDAPSWYVVNSNVTQANNVIATNACTVGNANSTCYVLTDRGTFDYLANGQSATTGTSLIPNLAIVTRNNSTSAPGGQYELVNYFHAYIINPSKPNESVNLTAAQDFINYLTSPSLQAQVKTYLASTSDTAGAPFIPDASPIITETGIPSTDTAGQSVTVTGSVTNAEPGYPTPTGETVSVDELEGGIPVPIASTTATSTGSYTITFTPPSSGSYQVSTGQISQVENATLNPWFGDILSPGASAAVPLTLQGTVSIAAAIPSVGGVTIAGTVGPAAPDASATVAVLARQQGSNGSYATIGTTTLAAGQSTNAVSASLGAGNWQVESTYQDGSQLATATSSISNVTVSPTTDTVAFKKVTVKKGALTVSGTLGQAQTAAGTQVQLYALATTTVKVTKTKSSGKKGKKGKATQTVRELFVAHAAAATFKRVGKTTVGAGKTTFTIKAKVKRGYRYVLQLEYIHTGQTASYSKLSSVDAH